MKRLLCSLGERKGHGNKTKCSLGIFLTAHTERIPERDKGLKRTCKASRDVRQLTTFSRHGTLLLPCGIL